MNIYGLLFFITLALWIVTYGIKDDKEYKPIYRTLYTLFNWMFLFETVAFGILSRY